MLLSLLPFTNKPKFENAGQRPAVHKPTRPVAQALLPVRRRCYAAILPILALAQYRTHLPPNSDNAALIALARTAAAQHSLNAALICAIVEQESACDPHAIRYEPAFRTRYVAPLGLPPTEEVARSISWGLMQVMGQVARGHNFTAKALAALCDPATGLAIGCAVFAAKLRASANDGDASGVAANVVHRALELWNGGVNTSYAAQVLARVARYQ